MTRFVSFRRELVGKSPTSGAASSVVMIGAEALLRLDGARTGTWIEAEAYLDNHHILDREYYFL